MAHLWAKWVPYPCRLGDPHRFTAAGKIRSGPLVGKGLRHPCDLGDAHRCTAGGRIRSGPLVGKVATSPVPSRGSPPLQSGGQNQKWPTCGQSGYVTHAVSGIPTAAQWGAKSEVAHLWAKWLRHPCRRWDPHRFREGGKIRSGPQVGKVALSPVPSQRSPALQSGGQTQRWPTCGRSGYVTTAVYGIPTALERVGKIRNGPLIGKVATPPVPSRGTPPLHNGGQNHKWPTYGQIGYVKVDDLWAKWLRHPCRLGDPQRYRAGGKIRKGPLSGKLATSPLPSRGSPPLHIGGQNRK